MSIDEHSTSTSVKPLSSTVAQVSAFCLLSIVCLSNLGILLAVCLGPLSHGRPCLVSGDSLSASSSTGIQVLKAVKSST